MDRRVLLKQQQHARVAPTMFIKKKKGLSSSLLTASDFGFCASFCVSLIFVYYGEDVVFATTIFGTTN